MTTSNVEIGRNPKLAAGTMDTFQVQLLSVGVQGTVQISGAVTFATIQVQGINTTVQVTGAVTQATPNNIIIVADVTVQPNALTSIAARSTRKELWLTATSSIASPARFGTTTTPAAFTGQPLYANSPAVVNTAALVMVFNPTGNATLTLAVAELDT